MSDRGCVRQLGWIDGHDIAIEYRWTQGRNDRAAVLTEVLRKCESAWGGWQTAAFEGL